MRNDKTLADVQPGGRVRLQQALPPEGYAGAWIRSAYGQPSSFTYWNMEVAYAAGWQAALSAQPSPGGQDATSQVVSRMVSTAPEKIFLQIGDGDYSDEPFPHPAGEEITWCSDSIVESEVAYVRADLASPRAHSVDLSRFRSLARWVANSAGHGINSGQRRMGEELLALIDSHAVGNK
jgi:hypothetical protein